MEYDWELNVAGSETRQRLTSQQVGRLTIGPEGRSLVRLCAQGKLGWRPVTASWRYLRMNRWNATSAHSPSMTVIG